MKLTKTSVFNWYKGLIKTSVLAILLMTLSIGLSGAWWNFNSDAPKSEPRRQSILAQGDAITDPNAILRYSLPIENDTIQKVQADIEDISRHLRGKRWPPILKDIKDASFLINVRGDKLLEGVYEEDLPEAEALVAELKEDIGQLRELTEAEDKQGISNLRGESLKKITRLETLMVHGFPFEVPEEYSNLPQLLGRATVEIETTKGNMTVIVDGYSAPVNGGNFVDLVQRGFYDGLEFIDIEDNFVVQIGDPPGPEVGFVDPDSGEYRAIPMEILVEGEDEPLYGMTLEDAGLYLDKPVIPFNAYGAMALARPAADPNGGSSQFFFFKFDNELTPPGFNLMDGRYSVFGYLVEGKNVLQNLTENDKIISAKVIDGLSNLVKPSES